MTAPPTRFAWCSAESDRPLLFEPVEFLEKLAALTPQPESNLVLSGGVGLSRALAAERRPRYRMWALLVHRALDLDVLSCPRCARRMQLIATIDDPGVIQEILARLGLPGAREGPRPPLPLTAAGAEQPTLPGVSVWAVQGAGATTDVCSAVPR
jgi:hypothetical protein